MNSKEINNLKKDILSYVDIFGENIKTKLNNITGKAAQHDVPEALWLTRTKIDDRILVSWKTVYKNKITYEQLESIKNGVVVEFINDDYYNDEFSSNDTYIKLKKKLGSNDTVSSII